MLFVTRRVQFSASHRLHNPELSPARNKELFGPCNNKNGHGHNYEVEVVVKGRPDPRTGMFINLTQLKAILEEQVVKVANHRSLDRDVPFMKGRLSTTENLAVAIWETVEPRLPAGRLHLVRVRESENNMVEYSGPEETHGH